VFVHSKALITLFLLTSIIGCTKIEEKKYQATKIFMGTSVSITIFSEDAAKANHAIKSAYAKIAELEQLFSKYSSNGEIYRINQSQTDKVKISPTVFEVIKKAVEFGKISNGAFDITVEPILRLWQEAEKKNILPTTEELKSAIGLTDYTNIILDTKSLAVEFSKPDMSIDVGGIAKGFIVGEAIKALKSQGISNGIITAGGDSYVLGNNPERKANWTIGIRNPLKPEENIKYIKVSDKAVATSGHYMRFYDIQGTKYSHIIDPRNGQPVQEKIASITVIANDGTLADGLSTAICVLGPEEGLKLAKSLPDVEVFIIVSKEGKLSFIQSDGFPKYLK
jgi:thiamine biosynthesis lipoprotein